MEFRRNHNTKLRGGSFRKRAILLVFVVLAMVFWMIYMSQNLVKPKKRPVLHVSFLGAENYLIGKDTTIYDNFASVLTMHVRNLKKQSKWIELHLTLPKDKNAAQVMDIVQIANAYEGVILKMHID